MITEKIFTNSKEVREKAANKTLTEGQARLYSQSLRKSLRQDGLKSFRPEEELKDLDEALLLIQCALIERRFNPNGSWRDGIKRAAEIMEWLSKLNSSQLESPLVLLSAAAYQLANYPAMALGQLRTIREDQLTSLILSTFLTANFPATLTAIQKFWQQYYFQLNTGQIFKDNITCSIFYEVIRCLGVVCTYFRQGNEDLRTLANDAIDKFICHTDSLIYSRDPYSFLLSTLTSASCSHFNEVCLWQHILKLGDKSDDSLNGALIQFAKASFNNRRSLIWPSQFSGIKQLPSKESFVLCTPTGSGKTTVATIALLQALFSELHPGLGIRPENNQGNLALYLVPSRALASEVEARLLQDFKGVSKTPVIITGLYGGIDWGPTDAWVQSDNPTIVVCTFEKADALLRYLGVLFLHRVRLIVIDEAHMVEQDLTRLPDLISGTSRSLRLEQLGVRILRAQSEYKFRIIALSAVAANAAPAMSRWIS